MSHPIADTTCPHCGNTSGVQPTANTARVTAWSCSDCGTEWAVSVVNPRLYLDRLTATVAARQFVSLADDAPGLTDTELRRSRALRWWAITAEQLVHLVVPSAGLARWGHHLPADIPTGRSRCLARGQPGRFRRLDLGYARGVVTVGRAEG